MTYHTVDYGGFKIFTLLFIFIGFIAFIGLIFLQIYLSKQQNKFYGFILPIFQFILSEGAIMT